jgi:tetratricopeptide (TPR) repeat protein
MRWLGTLLLVLSLSGVSIAPAEAAGGGSLKPKNPDFAQALKLVNDGNFAAALPLMEKVVTADPKNADALNVLGYSQRKLGDRDAALENYLAALEIDPEHRGANEYLGELYLEAGELGKAEERLKVLDGACFFGCDEYSELKESIETYKKQQGG